MNELINWITNNLGDMLVMSLGCFVYNWTLHNVLWNLWCYMFCCGLHEPWRLCNRFHNLFSFCCGERDKMGIAWNHFLNRYWIWIHIWWLVDFHCRMEHVCNHDSQPWIAITLYDRKDGIINGRAIPINKVLWWQLLNDNVPLQIFYTSSTEQLIVSWK